MKNHIVAFYMKIKSDFKNKSSLPRFGEIFWLTVPQTGLMLCHLAVSMTDIWTAGKIHSNLQASLGVVSQLNTMLVVLTSFIAGGCMAAVSQSLGAGLKNRANRFAGLIVMLAAVSGTATAVLALLAEERIYFLLKISPGLLPDVRVFYWASVLSLPFSYLLIMINSVFRSYKKVWLPFVTLFAMAAANFLGDLGFGLGCFGFPCFGIYGIAWTTFVCSVLGLAVNVFFAVRFSVLRKKSFAPWKWNRKAMPYLFKIGMPSALAQIVGQLGSLTLLAIVGAVPFQSTVILAGMSIALRIHGILLFPLGALNMTVVILSGYMLGAEKKAELVRFGAKTAFVTAAVTVLPAFVLWLFREPAAAVFSAEASVREQVVLFLGFICCSVPFSAAAGVLNGVFSGTGATALSAKLGIFACWFVSVPFSYLFAVYLEYGAVGIYGTDLAVKILYFALTLYVFYRKKWLNCGLKKRGK